MLTPFSKSALVKTTLLLLRSTKNHLFTRLQSSLWWVFPSDAHYNYQAMGVCPTLLWKSGTLRGIKYLTRTSRNKNIWLSLWLCCGFVCLYFLFCVLLFITLVEGHDWCTVSWGWCHSQHANKSLIKFLWEIINFLLDQPPRSHFETNVSEKPKIKLVWPYLKTGLRTQHNPRREWGLGMRLRCRGVAIESEYNTVNSGY